MRLRQRVTFEKTAEELGRMFAPSNEVTVKSWERRWMDNIVANLQLHPQMRSLDSLLGQITRHISLVVGAGWTLNKMRQHAPQIPPHWGIIVPDHALLPILQMDLKPTLVCTMDGHQHTEPAILEGFRLLKQKHPETPVAVDIVCCPSVVELIENPYWFRSAGDPNHIVGRYANRECADVTQMGHGGNVGSVCTIMAKFFCFSRHVVLIGMNYSMFPGTKNVDYWHLKQMPDEHQYVQVCDIYGRPTWTMANLHNYKWWMDHFCYSNDSVEWILANDGGFLGVQGPTTNYDHFTYLPLGKAIDYLNSHTPEDLMDY